MEWEQVSLWVNRVGIVLEFLSFWFAAPEILGEERLRALEHRVERGIRVLPLAMFFLAVVILPFLVVGGGVAAVASAAILALATLLLARLGVGAATVRLLEDRQFKLAVAASTVWLGLLAFLLFLTELLASEPKVPVDYLLLGVSGVIYGLLLNTSFLLHDKVVSPLLLRLADDKGIRQRSLAIGAVLFVVGFLLQLVATF